MSDSESDSGSDWEDSSSSDDSEVNEEVEAGETEAKEESDPDEKILNTIKKRKASSETHYSVIELEELIGAVCFSPTDSNIALGTGDGNIYLYSYPLPNQIGCIEAHTEDIQAIDYADDGLFIYSVSNDKTIVVSDSNRMSMVNFYEDAMGSDMTRVKSLKRRLFITGDSSGSVKIWDDRARKSVFTNGDEIQDYVTSFAVLEGSDEVVGVTSGDGFVTQYDLRKFGVKLQSEQISCDITCSAMVQSTKLVCGTIKGEMRFYHWKTLFDSGAYLPMKKGSINAMTSLSENLIVTSWDDRTLRAHTLFPHGEIGIVGQHDDSPSISLDVSHDGLYVASAPLSTSMKIFNVQYLDGTDLQAKKKRKTTNFLPSSDYDNRANFFSEL